MRSVISTVVSSRKLPISTMLSLTVLLLVAVTGVLSTSQVPRCTPEMTNKVHAQWKKTGVPQGVTGLTDPFKIVAGSASSISKQEVCKTFKFIPGYLYDENDKISLPCSEKNGVLTLPDSLSLIVTFDHKVLTSVRCSKDGPAPTKDNPIVLSLGATSNATAKEIQKNYDILSKLGIAIHYYKC